VNPGVEFLSPRIYMKLVARGVEMPHVGREEENQILTYDHPA